MKKIILLIILITLAFYNNVSSKPQKGGTLRFGHLGDFQYFNPYKLPLADWPMFNQLFNVLIRYDNNLNSQPELAKSWKFSEDKISLTLNLREDVYFHNGRKFNADDVVFSLEYVQKKESGANIRTLALSVESTEILNESKIKINFKKPTPAAFDLLDLLFIVNKETIDTIDSNPIGTGPFRFVEWSPGDYAKFKRFERYWKKDLPYLENIIVKAIPSSGTMVSNLEAGSLHVIAAPPPSEYNRLSSLNDLKTYKGFPGGLVWNISLNLERKPFNNKKVRHAMQYALDRKRIVETVFFNLSEPWIQPQSDKSILYDSKLEGRFYFDLNKAKNLLEETGTSGFEFTVMTATTKPEGSKLLEVYQADLSKIGIKLNIENVEPAQYRPRARKRDFDAAVFTYGRASKDPSSLFGTTGVWRAKPWNLSNYYTEKYSNLILSGQHETNLAKRSQIYKKLNKLQLEESFIIVITPIIRWWAMSENIEGFNSNLDSMPILEKVYIK